MTRLLHDNITGGTGTAAYTGCAGQAGKTGTTDNYTDAWFAGYQPNLATVVWVGYPQSNDIEMTSVHGITVFGGTFPAEIWNSVYSDAEVPCEEFSEPETPISWAPFFGHYTASGPAARLLGGKAGEEAETASRCRDRARSVATTPTRTRRASGRNRPRLRLRLPARRAAAAAVMPGSAAAPRPAGSGLAEGSRARRALGLAGLAGLLATAVPLVAPGPGLVPAAGGGAPGWLLGVYGGGLGIGPGAYYALLWAAFAAYLCVLVAAPAIGRRTLVAAAVVLIVAFALSPPLLSQDVFSYIAYARLGVVHGLNPYTHAPIDALADPSFPHVGWTESASSYGPLFTLATYPLAHLSVPAAIWTLKAVAAASVLALGLLAARIAPARGIDPRRCFAIVALNPLVLVHVVGGAHNDATVMLAALAGCAAVIALRERRRGCGSRRRRPQAERRLRRPVRAARLGAARSVPRRRGIAASRPPPPAWRPSAPMSSTRPSWSATTRAGSATTASPTSSRSFSGSGSALSVPWQRRRLPR